MNNFNYCLSIGEKTQEVIKQHLAARGHEIEDVSLNTEYQKKDIDFIVRKGNKFCTLEVKSDTKMHQTGNFFFELSFERKTGERPGWFQYCEAQFVCFYDGIAGRGYILDFNKTKKYLDNHGVCRKWWNNTDSCYGWAVLLSIAEAEEAELVAYEWLTED